MMQSAALVSIGLAGIRNGKPFRETTGSRRPGNRMAANSAMIPAANLLQGLHAVKRRNLNDRAEPARGWHRT